MSLQLDKTDPILGQAVHEHLVRLGIETPRTEGVLENDKKKINKIGKHFSEVLKVLGMDLEDGSIRDTPNRIAKMLVNETMWGLRPEHFPKIANFDVASQYSQTVQETGITVMSNCEHHWATIDGFATVSYIPKNKVIGLSKLNRVVEYFSRRPQVQERLTLQIAEALKFVLEVEDVAVAIDAVHYCVKSRGVGDANCMTRTTSLHGAFLANDSARKEFLMFHNSHKR